MLEILEILAERHITPTRVMIMVRARCSSCGTVKLMRKQYVDRCNNEKRAHCSQCPETARHRMTGTRPHRIWRGMLARIDTPETKGFKHYGGLGITVDPSWQDFRNFWRDMQAGYSDDLTIERNDVNGPYSKDNCRWVTNMEQQANKRNNRLIAYKGQQLHLAEFCRVAGVTRGAITAYLKRFHTGDAAMAAYSRSSYPRWRVSRKKSTTL